MTGNPKNHLVHFLAPARIARYRSFLKLATNEEVHRAYAWNYAISAMVFPLLGCVEMHLRDAVHRVMSQRYAPAGAATGHHGYPWYDDAQAQHYPFAKEAKASIDGILCDKKTKARRNPQPTTDDVVAALTFGFWTNFFRTLSPVDAYRLSRKFSRTTQFRTLSNGAIHKTGISWDCICRLRTRSATGWHTTSHCSSLGIKGRTPKNWRLG